MKRYAGLLLCMLGLAGASSAYAVPIPPLNVADFRDAVWNPAGGTTKTVGDITASAFVYVPLVGTLPTALNQTSDGFGSGYIVEPDEINPLQWITVDFAGGRAIDQAWVANLFPDEIKVCTFRIIICLQYDYVDEIGAYSANGGSQMIFTASDADGNLRLDLDGAVIDTITFYVPPGLSAQNIKSDFSLVGFAVPEPATAAVLGLGLLGLGWSRRRRLT